MDGIYLFLLKCLRTSSYDEPSTTFNLWPWAEKVSVLFTGSIRDLLWENHELLIVFSLLYHVVTSYPAKLSAYLEFQQSQPSLFRADQQMHTFFFYKAYLTIKKKNIPCVVKFSSTEIYRYCFLASSFL